MATTTTIRGITYNAGNSFTTAYSGKWYGSADGGNGSGTVTTGKSVTFYEDRTGWADWYYHPILCKGGGFNGGDYFWTDTNIFPYAKVTVNFDSGGGTKTYTWGTGGNFPSVTKTGYKHTGWQIDGVTYSATSAVINSWISERNNQTKTATAVWEAQASTISSATNVTLSTSGTVNSTVSWNALSSSFTYVLTASLGNASASATYNSLSGNVSKTLGFSGLFIDQITASKSSTVTITLTTKNGSTVLGTSQKAITLTVPNSGINPSTSFVSGFPAKSAVTSNPFTVPVTNLDAIRVKWGYTPYKYNNSSSGSPLTSGTVKIGSSTWSDISGDRTSSVLNTIGSTSVQVTVTDKRGNSGSASTTIGVYEYYYPSPTVTFQKSSSTYSLRLGGKFASVNGQNTTRTMNLDVYKNGTKVNQADISLNSYIGSAVTQGSSTPYNDYYAISGTYTIDVTDVDGQGTDISDIASETYEFRVTATDRAGSTTVKTASGIAVMTFGAGGTDIKVHKPIRYATYPEAYYDLRMRDKNGNTFSVGESTTMSNDLNDYSATGIVWCRGTTLNKPPNTTQFGFFMPIRAFGSDNDKFQLYFAWQEGTPVPYMRWQTNSGKWYEWAEIQTNQDSRRRVDATWKVTSSSAVGVEVTNRATLTKGFWVVHAHIPNGNFSTRQAFRLSAVSGTTDINNDWWEFMLPQSGYTSVVRVTSDSAVITLITGFSASVTYDYTERGGLRCLKV